MAPSFTEGLANQRRLCSIAVTLSVIAIWVSAPPSLGAADELEPYLRTSFADLVQQVRSEQTSEAVAHRAMLRIARDYPDQAPDAFVEFLYMPGGQSTGHLLFELGRPNSKSVQLIEEIRKGRMAWTKEHIEAFALALAWPGNRAAEPALKAMIEEGWDTAGVARLCLARIKAADSPDPLLNLPEYQDGILYADRVARLIRKSRWRAANALLLGPMQWTASGPSRLGPSPAKGVTAIREGRAAYALAWKGNRTLAEAFLRHDPHRGPVSDSGYAADLWAIAAVRTGDPRCRERVRRHFEDDIRQVLNPDGTAKPGMAFRAPYYYAIAGAEAADENTAPFLTRLLTHVEREREKARDRIDELRRRRPPPPCMLMDGDPLGLVRRAILKGLCVNPLRNTRDVLEHYMADPELGRDVGLALLRSGDPEGIPCLLNRSQQYGFFVDENIFLIYTGADNFSKTRSVPGPSSIARAREWYRLHRDDSEFRKRIASVNASDLLEPILEGCRDWP